MANRRATSAARKRPIEDPPGQQQEIPARMCCGKDLDLAFIRPARSWRPDVRRLPASAKLQPLDEMVILDRLGKAASRTESDSTASGSSKPRTFYVPAVGVFVRLRSPVSRVTERQSD
jgi:hypothetical protein